MSLDKKKKTPILVPICHLRVAEVENFVEQFVDQDEVHPNRLFAKNPAVIFEHLRVLEAGAGVCVRVERWEMGKSLEWGSHVRQSMGDGSVGVREGTPTTPCDRESV